MDRKTLVLLAGGVGFLMVLVYFVGAVAGGLPRETLALIDAESQNLLRDRSTFSKEKGDIDSAILSEPALFSSSEFKEGWGKRLEEAQKRLDDAQKDLDSVLTLKEENNRDSQEQINELLTRVRAARIFAVNETSEMSSVADARVDFKRNRAEKVRELQGAHKAVAGANFSAIRSRVEQAVIDWPGKREDLNGRLDSVTRLVGRADEAWKIIQEENAKEEGGAEQSDVFLNYDRMIDAAISLKEYQKTLPANTEQIGNLIDQLYRSWDRILVDMEIREGLDVTFYQKFKIIEWVIKDVSKKENEHTEREELVQVSAAQYKAMEKSLGMTVEHKSAGKYDHEAEKVAQPAGYAYIAPLRQGHNQYGEWRSGAGGSFWVFYGQYALMRNLFWGPRYYRPIYANDYNGYYSANRSGRTYYGRGSAGRPRYGTGGTFTSSRYSNSAYSRTGGFRNSQYVRSRGTYRGSRYETRRTSSSSRGYFGRTSRSSGSRFGRGK